MRNNEEDGPDDVGVDIDEGDADKEFDSYVSLPMRLFTLVLTLL